MSVSDEHCLEIGRSTVAFADLEIWLSFFAWALIGPDQHVGQIVTAEMSFSRKLDLVSSLFAHRSKDIVARKELQGLLGRLAELEQRRNTVQHSMWVRQSTDPSVATRLKITAKRKHGLKHAREEVSAEPLRLLNRDLQAALSDFSTFMTAFLATQ